jgi:Na+/proline symporter
VLPLPAIAAVSTLLFNQNFWMRDDLASASPRAFLNLLFLAFLYYLLRESLLPCLVAIGLLGLVYPQYVLVAAGILLLRLVPRRKESRSWRSIKFCLAGLAVACLVLLPFALTSAQFGPVITVTEARTLPEFAAGGRARFFFADLGRYWLTAGRSGIQLPLDPPLLGLALLLPVLSRFPTRFPLVQQTRQLGVLVQLTIAALLLFFAAHALLFKLHLPSRYTQHSLRIVMAIGAAIALAILLDALWRSANDRQIYHRLVAIGLTGLTIAFLLLYPFSLGNFPRTTYLKGSAAPLYEFFAQQPKSSLIASLSEEANQVPIFARRSIFVGSEYAIPYHVGYYRIFRQRVLDLIQAQYSPNRKVVQAFIQQQEIDFWLLDRAAFTTDYLAQNSWLRQYQPAHQKALATLQHNTIPALQTLMPRCTAFEMPAFVVLDTACITAASVGMPRP